MRSAELDSSLFARIFEKDHYPLIHNNLNFLKIAAPIEIARVPRRKTSESRPTGGAGGACS